jgi:hypothetical protein
MQIDEEAEEQDEDDPGNVSETGSQNGTKGATVPTTLTSPRMILKLADTLSYHPTTTGEHTRTNSSKAQSLKGSIIL